MTNRQKGFTLIELLVVIAIIGVLSSIVLASLNRARDKGTDAKTKEQLHSARENAEVYFDENGNYGVATDLCDQEMFADSKMSAFTTATNYIAPTTLSCHSDGTTWGMSASLATPGEYWCVDSQGTATNVSAQLADGDTICD